MRQRQPSSHRIEAAPFGLGPNRRLFQLLPWGLLVLALVLVFSQVRRPALLVSVWVPWVEVGTLAFVMTAIILTGGIDLSVGSTVALSGMIQAVLWQDWGWPIEAAAAAALLAGALAGGFNGLLVVAGLSPLVATLATMALYRGLGHYCRRRGSDHRISPVLFGHGEISGDPESILAGRPCFAGNIPVGPPYSLRALVFCHRRQPFGLEVRRCSREQSRCGSVYYQRLGCRRGGRRGNHAA